MIYQHQNFADGRWAKMAFVEQMAHIGSEVERALNWQAKHNAAHSQKAFERALELADLTLDSGWGGSRLKEVARVREALVDYFSGANEFGSTEKSWRRYFFNFGYAARKGR
ncbi:MAG: hypothetical protein ABH891_01870 [Candidatus Omnitrophota bacterium]